MISPWNDIDPKFPDKPLVVKSENEMFAILSSLAKLTRQIDGLQSAIADAEMRMSDLHAERDSIIIALTERSRRAVSER